MRRKSVLVRLMASVALVQSLAFLGACSGDDSPADSSAEDCARGVLFEGGEYVEAGYFLNKAQTLAGTASLAKCSDTAADSSGLVFSDDGQAASVWRIGSVAEADAVGLEVGSRYAVMLSEALSEQERSAVLDTLGLKG